MAESGLSLGYPDFQLAVGHFLGYGRDPLNWTADRVSDVNEIIQSGYRQFLWPPIVPGKREAHVWSWIAPVASQLAILSGVEDYDLPDDFGGVVGTFTFTGDLTYWPLPMQVVGEPQIRLERQRTSFTYNGKPRLCAIVAKRSVGTTGQRHQITIYPTPDADYTMAYRYNIRPPALSEAEPYPIGGTEHGETLLYSCLSIAESRRTDNLGIHFNTFLQRLQSSISIDYQNMTLDTAGYNSNEEKRQRFRRSANVTYNSVLYD